MVRAKVTVHKATDVPKMDTFGWADPYVKFKGATTQVQYGKSSTIKKEKNPVWNDAVAVINRDTVVRIKLYDQDMTKDDVIGEVKVDIREAVDNVPMQVMTKQGQRVGETKLWVTVEVLPAPPKFVPYGNADAGTVMLNTAFEGHTSLRPHYTGKVMLPIASIYEEVDAFCPGAQVLPAIAPDTLYGGRIVEHQGVLAKYEVPMGLVQRLDALGHFEALDVIVDDSGSMQCGTDMKHPETGGGLTRWEEVYWRLFQMLEVMSMAPQLPPAMTVRFLNSKEVLDVARQNQEPPGVYVSRIKGILRGAWDRFKSGGTPVMAPLQRSFAAYEGRSCIRYFYGDGVPNEPVQQVVQLVANRSDPTRNPFTFFSCTNDDGCTEWMKECEEAAPYCAEYDDYGDEVAEMVHDQGPAFPFTMGVYLIASAVGACFPEDLDAMDEGVPLTKASLESILGYYTTAAQYKVYFDGMLRAVDAHRPRGHLSPVDRIKYEHTNVWRQNYEAFMGSARAIDIPAVMEYKNAVRNAITSTRRR